MNTGLDEVATVELEIGFAVVELSWMGVRNPVVGSSENSEMLLDPRFNTYTYCPFTSVVTAMGLVPAANGDPDTSVNAPVVELMVSTETEFAAESATKAKFSPGSKLIAIGPAATKKGEPATCCRAPVLAIVYASTPDSSGLATYRNLSDGLTTSELGFDPLANGDPEIGVNVPSLAIANTEMFAEAEFNAKSKLPLEFIARETGLTAVETCVFISSSAPVFASMLKIEMLFPSWFAA